MPATLQITLDFLTELRFNNHKTWFDENRARYQKARSAFEEFVGGLIRQFSAVEDLGETSVKDCLYRINRDIRFSKDKSPYNAHMAALLARGGRKAGGRAYYIHIEPGGASMIAGGEYMPSPENLGKIRRHIAQTGDQFKAILTRMFSTCAWIDTSRAEIGSSQIMSFGRRANARAIPIRWRWPPENSCG